MKIRCVQINLRKSLVCHTNLAKELQARPNTIAMIQEPNTYKGRIDMSLFKDHNCVYQPYPRAAILVPKGLNFLTLAEETNKDLCCIEISLHQTNFIMANCYLDILDKNVIPLELISLVERCNQHKKALVIGGDVNAHSTLWNCPNSNKRGEVIEYFILKYQLQVHNIGDTHTFIGSRGHSIIDITLSLNTAQQSIHDWKVLRDTLGSDHRMVQFYLNNTIKLEKASISKVNWHKVKREEVNIRIPERVSKEVLDQLATDWTSQVKNIVEKNTKYRKRKSKSWWNTDLDFMRKVERKLRDKWNKKPTQNNRKIYVEHRNKYKKAILHAKLQTHRQDISSMDDPKTASRIARNNPNFFTPSTLIRADGTHTRDQKETIKLLAETYFPSHSTQEIGNNFEEVFYKDAQKQSKFCNKEKIKLAIKQFKIGKAPGPDKITPLTLRNLPKMALDQLIKIYKLAIALKYVPKIWREATVIFIPKPGRTIHGPKDLRPISLMSYVFKTMERLLQWHWDSDFKLYKTIHPFQYGFKKGVSTETAVSHLVDCIEHALEHKLYALTVFIDITSAFDNLKADRLLEAFQRKGCMDNSVLMYVDYVKHRTININYAGDQEQFHIKDGCPQGGVLSPNAWNINFDSLICIFDGSRILFIGFADDGSLTVWGTNVEELILIMQKGLRKVEAWAQEQGLALAPHKTKAIIFSNDKHINIESLTKLTINQKEIEYVDNFTYLGVKLQRQLDWYPMLQEKVKKITKDTYQLQRLVAKEWGLKPQLAKWVYEQMFITKITYCSHVWVKLASTYQMQNLLQKLQRAGLLLITPAFRSTPTAGLEIILGIPPLDLQILAHATAAHARIIKKLKPTSKEGHLAWILNWNKENNIPTEIPIDEDVDTTWNRDFDVSTGENRPSLTPRKQGKSHILHVFTDGSKSVQQVGAGFVICDDKGIMHTQKIRLDLNATAQQAETVAILRAAHWLINSPKAYQGRLTGKNKVIMNVDAKYALHALADPFANSKTVKDTVKKLNVLARKYKVSLNWIPSHSNHLYHDIADQLARTAHNALHYYPTTIKKATLRKITTNTTDHLWFERWHNVSRYRQTRELFPTHNDKIAKLLIKKDRNTIYRFCQLMTGHNVFKRHLQIMGWINNSDCRFCGVEEESSSHILLNCEGLSEARESAFGKERLEYPEGNTEWELGQILEFIISIGKLYDLNLIPEEIRTLSFKLGNKTDKNNTKDKQTKRVKM